jgi:ABC-2 type transport system ATP-binding protein
VNTGSKALIEAARALDDESIHPLDIGLRRPSLDDVFISLTGHAAEEEKEQEVVDPRARKRKKK